MELHRDAAPLVEVQGLSKRFGNAMAVDDVWFDLAPGEIFGFLGPNGAGKTTTIRMLTGLLRPGAGTARIAGNDIVREPVAVKRVIGYLADPPYLYPKLTGREFLQLTGDLYGVDRRIAEREAGRLLELFDLGDKAGQLTESYSHGMRQKLGLAAALLHAPRVLFLDEPTSGLDPRSARIVKDLLGALARQGRTVLLSTHVLEIAEQMCHRVGIINQGRLIALGTMEQLRRQGAGGDASLEDIFLSLTGGPEARDLAAYLGSA